MPVIEETEPICEEILLTRLIEPPKDEVDYAD